MNFREIFKNLISGKSAVQPVAAVRETETAKQPVAASAPVALKPTVSANSTTIAAPSLSPASPDEATNEATNKALLNAIAANQKLREDLKTIVAKADIERAATCYTEHFRTGKVSPVQKEALTQLYLELAAVDRNTASAGAIAKLEDFLKHNRGHGLFEEKLKGKDAAVLLPDATSEEKEGEEKAKSKSNVVSFLSQTPLGRMALEAKKAGSADSREKTAPELDAAG